MKVVSETAYDAVQILKGEFPALSYQIPEQNKIKNLFKTMQLFADYTREQLIIENEAEVERCYAIAREVLIYGTNIARLAVSNVFVYSLCRLLDKGFSVPQRARATFLKYFRKEYEEQLYGPP